MFLITFLGLIVFAFCILFSYSLAMFLGDIHSVYLAGIMFSLFLYLIISALATLMGQGAEEFLSLKHSVPGFIVGCVLAAGYHSTGSFIADAAVSHEGLFAVSLLAIVMGGGYFICNGFLGRYLHRTGVVSLSEYFRKRFCSETAGKFWTFIIIFTISIYIISVTLGLGSLMQKTTGLDYLSCITIMLFGAMLCVMVAGYRGGPVGVIMVLCTVLGVLVGLISLSYGLGGWNVAVAKIVNSGYHDFITWRGTPILYHTITKNYIWGILLAMLYMSISMAAPWQLHVYLTAKNETEITKGSLWGGVLVIVLWFMALAASILVHATPEHMPMTELLMLSPGKYMQVWAGMFWVVGVVAAGLSSLTIFLSIVASVISHSMIFRDKNFTDEQKANTGRISLILLTVVIWIAMFFIKFSMYGTMVGAIELAACTTLPVLYASVWSKKLTNKGAIAGGLSAFIVVFGLQFYYGLRHITPYIWLLPLPVGVTVNIIAMCIVSSRTEVTEEEKAFRESMFVIPEEEKKPENMKRNLRWARASIWVGVITTVLLIALWVAPILNAK